MATTALDPADDFLNRARPQGLPFFDRLPAFGRRAGARSICIILQDFALGGTERVALRLARAWSEEGREVTLFCGEADGALRSLIEGSAVRLVTARIRRRRGSVARLGRAAARFLMEQPHDACFIPGNYHWNAIPPIADLPAAVRPRLIAQLSSPISKPQRRGLRKIGFRWKMQRFLGEIDALVTLSDSQRGEALHILPGIPVHSIALPAVPDAPAALHPAAGTTIVAAGRLVPQKAFGDLISGFALMKTEDARLIIVGEGPERKRLEKLVARLGIGHRVSLPGFVEDIRPALDAARLFVLSSHYEGYGAVVVEALAAGRPVVATDCTPATRELLRDNRYGVTVPIENPTALARAMERMLMQNAPDPALLADAVGQHRIAPVARAYLALFDEEPQLALVNG